MPGTLATSRSPGRRNGSGGQLFVALAGLAEVHAGHVAGVRDRTLEQVPDDDLVDDSEGIRFAGLDRVPFHTHLQGLFDTREARQALRAAGSRDEAELHFGLPHLGRRNRHAVMPGHGGFEAAAERSPVNGHHDGFRALLDLFQKGIQANVAALIARGDLSEFVDVRARNERAARADDDDGLHGIVAVSHADARRDSLRNARAEGVYGRVVDGNDQDFAVA